MISDILVVVILLVYVSTMIYIRNMKNKKVIFICDNPELYPYKKHDTDAGWDIKAAESLVIPPNEYRAIATGLKVAVPVGYYGHILPRSGLALRSGIMTMAGVIDSEYRDEIRVILYNASNKPFKITQGDRIAQFVVEKILLDSRTVTSIEASELNIMETERGTAGFGSTGI